MSSAPIPALESVVDAITDNVNKHTPESQMIYEREQMQVQSIWEEEIQYTTKFVQYNRVVVMMLYWAQSDLNKPELDLEINDLGVVFEEEYGFKVIYRELDSQDNPALKLRKYLVDFVYENTKKGEETLLIVYYAGHGWGVQKKPNTNSMPDFMLADVTSFDETQVEAAEETWIAWRGAEDILAKAMHADVLAIFDCCDTGSLCHLRAPHKFEFLGACSVDQRTKPAGPQSFTRALIWALQNFKQQRKKKFFTTRELRKKITEAPDFPLDQCPQLGTRKPTSDQIVIAPSSSKLDSQAREVLEKAEASRKPNSEFLDLRFRFDGPLNKKTIRDTAKVLRTMMLKKKLPVTGITCLEKHSRHDGRFSGAVKKVMYYKRYNHPGLAHLLNQKEASTTPATTVRATSEERVPSGNEAPRSSRQSSPPHSTRTKGGRLVARPSRTPPPSGKRALEPELNESPRRQSDRIKRPRLTEQQGK